MKNFIKLNFISCLFAIFSCSTDYHSADKLKLMPFEEIKINFNRHWNHTKFHPFTGAAAIDIDGDNKNEFFIGGGEGQDDALFSFQNGELVDIIAGTNLSNKTATYGATSIDIDNDDDVDLIIARNDGVYIYLNNKGVFSENKLVINLPKDSVPFAVAVSDIDHDGDGDLYISTFVDFPHFKSATFNNPNHAKPNLMLLNEGNLKFVDITESSKTASKQNTFQSVFVDLNNDGWDDLVASQNTGEVEIFQNLKNKTFKRVVVSEGYGFWMGVAIGDIDRDGDQDLFFTNVGKTIPLFLTKGDINKDQKPVNDWLLLRNDKEFKFVNITKEYDLSGHGFAWGAAFEDLNNDGNLDLLVAQNYVKWPLHKLFKLDGEVLLQIKDQNNAPKFVDYAKEFNLRNRHFGQAPLIIDLNDDGKEDVVWINMEGPTRAFLNQGTMGNFINISFPDKVSYLGTKVTLVMNDGQKTYSRVLLNSSSTMIDQSSELSFGIGDATEVQSLIIEIPGKKKKVIKNPKINQKLLAIDL
jgi:hypothetical protein